jgi:hypothetical protein
MVRRRTAVSTAAAVVLLLASPALTACGSSGPGRTGAAAVVGDQRISVSSLQAKVNAVRAEQAGSPQGDQMIAQSGKLSTQTLNLLVVSAVVEKAAQDAGVSASGDEVAQQHDMALQQAGGNQKALDALLLQQYGFGTAEADTFFRTNVLVGKLIVSLGYQPGSDGGNTALNAALAKTAKKLGVTVNPRYGTWDPKNVGIGKAHDPWVVDSGAGTASPLGAPAA